MQVRIRLFALQRQQVGWRDRSIDVPDGATIGDAWQHLVAEFPVLEPSTGVVRFARNARYADAGEPLADGDEMAVIPPVAGGATGSPADHRFRRIELSAAPLDDALLVELRRTVPSPRDGAVVSFIGQTRDSPGTAAPGQEAEAARFEGQTVEGLSYEAFEEMAIATIASIADEIEQRFGVTRVAVIHRTGEVPVGEASVIICAAAPHRSAAFEACRYAIEELKARAPIWKAERFADGSVWLGSPPRSGPLEHEEAT
jgi:molybdopterin synthase catalytic subunit